MAKIEISFLSGFVLPRYAPLNLLAACFLRWSLVGLTFCKSLLAVSVNSSDAIPDSVFYFLDALFEIVFADDIEQGLNHIG